MLKYNQCHYEYTLKVGQVRIGIIKKRKKKYMLHKSVPRNKTRGGNPWLFTL